MKLVVQKIIYTITLGWLLKAKIADSSELDELFSEEEYAKFCEEQEE